MGDALLSQAEIDALLKELPSGGAESGAAGKSPESPSTTESVPPGSVGRSVKTIAERPAESSTSHPNVERILDIPLQVAVNLGQAARQIEEVISLLPGAIVEFDREVGEPVDIVLNGKLIARGEVVVVNENFGVRITRIVSPQERIEKMI